MTRFDAVVVGAGTAGSVLAARLSEDPAREVLLIEAGPVPRSIAGTPSALLDARRVPGAEPAGAWNRWFDVELADGRDWRVSRGRVSGGSSTTNGAYFVRPRRRDLLLWSGGSGRWSPEAALPLLRRLERDIDFGTSPLHGDHGPVPVSRAGFAHPAAHAFVEAAIDLGHPYDADGNGDAEHGVGPMPANAVGGVRWSTASAYLVDAMHRPNLHVRDRTTVRRIRFLRGRAVGVATDDGAVDADLVVLAAGALTTPELLLRSGIGPADAVRAAGVPVVLDAPGVGAQLSDHPQVAVEWMPVDTVSEPADGWAGALLDLPSGGDGDLEVLQSLVPMARLTGPGGGGPLPLLVSAHEPIAPGRLTLQPDGRIRIQQGYLRTGSDRARLREAVRAAAEVLLSHSFASLSAGLVGLGTATPLGDDRALDDWIVEHLGTALHTCATVPFRLPDGSAGPVDETGRVRGTDALVVADTSILPTSPLRGPAATAVLIGEVVASSLRGSGGPSPGSPERRR